MKKIFYSPFLLSLSWKNCIFQLKQSFFVFVIPLVTTATLVYRSSSRNAHSISYEFFLAIRIDIIDQDDQHVCKLESLFFSSHIKNILYSKKQVYWNTAIYCCLNESYNHLHISDICFLLCYYAWQTPKLVKDFSDLTINKLYIKYLLKWIS